MARLNRWQGIGNVGKAPQARELPSGDTVATFSVAVDRVWIDAKGEKREVTDWIPCEARGRLAGFCLQYVTSGRQVYVEGRLQIDVVGEGDERRYYPKVIVSDIQLLGPRPSDEQGLAAG